MEGSTATDSKFDINCLLESAAFGMTDGVICFLGIIVGVARATGDAKAVLIAAIVGGIADALGNSIGFFVSQSAERAVQLQETNGNEESHVHTEREVWLSGVSSFLATLATLVLLLIPFFFLEVWPATAVSFVTGVVMAFTLGNYVATLGTGSRFRSGLKYALVTVAGAAVSYGIGELLSILLH